MQAIVLDTELLESSPQFFTAATSSHLLASLFDMFFMHFLQSHKNRPHVPVSEKLLSEIQSILSSMRSDIAASGDIQRALGCSTSVGPQDSATTKQLSAASIAIEEIRQIIKRATSLNIHCADEDIEKASHGSTSTSASTSASSELHQALPLSPPTTSLLYHELNFGPIETVSLIFMLQSHQLSSPMPLPWVHTLALPACLQQLLQGQQIRCTVL